MNVVKTMEHEQQQKKKDQRHCDLFDDVGKKFGIHVSISLMFSLKHMAYNIDGSSN